MEITFKTAKLAKEKGYPQSKRRVIGKYREDGHIQKGGPCAAVCDKNREWFEAPKQSELQKWLREKHHILVEISINFTPDTEEDFGYGASIISNVNVWNKNKWHATKITGVWRKTPEEALEKAFPHALDLIK